LLTDLTDLCDGFPMFSASQNFTDQLLTVLLLYAVPSSSELLVGGLGTSDRLGGPDGSRKVAWRAILLMRLEMINVMGEGSAKERRIP